MPVEETSVAMTPVGQERERRERMLAAARSGTTAVAVALSPVPATEAALPGSPLARQCAAILR